MLVADGFSGLSCLAPPVGGDVYASWGSDCAPPGAVTVTHDCGVNVQARWVFDKRAVGNTVALYPLPSGQVSTIWGPAFIVTDQVPLTVGVPCRAVGIRFTVQGPPTIGGLIHVAPFRS